MMNKIKQKYIGILAAIIGLALLNSCEESLELRIPYPNDITFNELTLDRFTYEIPTAPFTAGDNESGVITVNVAGTGNSFSGFALSNKNFRSYPWNLSPDFAPVGGLTAAEEQEEINTTAFSVYTDIPNKTENYLVGNTTGDNAFFTLSTPGTVEHVLIANTSYNYLLSQYGSIFSDDYDDVTESYLIDGGKIYNPNIANPDTGLEGRFRLPAPNGFEAVRLRGHQNLERDKAGMEAYDAVILAGGTVDEAEIAKENAEDNLHTGYVKLTIEGFLNESSTGTVEWYLSVLEEVDAVNPELDFTLYDWQVVDLTSLGDVDKVLFKVSSSYVHPDGTMVYPPTFCLDGIRLEKQ